MSLKPSSRIQFEFQSPYRTTSRLKVSQQKTLYLQTIFSCSRRKQWQSLESRQGTCWLTQSLYRSVLCHFEILLCVDLVCIRPIRVLRCLFNREPMTSVGN